MIQKIMSRNNRNRKNEIPSIQKIDEVLSGKSDLFASEEVAEWFSTEEGNSYISEEMDKLYLEEGMCRVDHPVPSEIMWNSIVRRHRNRKRTRYFAAAAVALLLLCGGLFSIQYRHKSITSSIEQREIYVANGDHMQVLFQDGTKVTLNSNSRLRYPSQFGKKERVVGLEGEALFEVAHIDDQEFFVEMPKGCIRVTGTVFNVKAYPESNEIKIFLKEGGVDYTINDQTISMTPGDLLTYNKATNKIKVTRAANAELLSKWTEKVLYFQDAPLQEVIDELERIYGLRFTVTDTSVYDNVFTIVFNNKEYKEILSDLTKISPLRFEVDGKNITIRKR